MDDPIFDPWSIGEPEADPAPAPRAKRWRSASSQEGVPATRPVPAPVTQQRAESEQRPAPTNATPDPVPETPVPSSAGHDLRALVIPRIEDLIQRLEMARHRTTVDDRLDRSPASIRIKVDPWRAPFDEGPPVSGSVLEILAEDGASPVIVGRIWLDALSASPTEQSQIDLSKLTPAWIEGLLLDFVAKALRSV